MGLSSPAARGCPNPSPPLAHAQSSPETQRCQGPWRQSSSTGTGAVASCLMLGESAAGPMCLLGAPSRPVPRRPHIFPWLVLSSCSLGSPPNKPSTPTSLTQVQGTQPREKSTLVTTIPPPSWPSPQPNLEQREWKQGPL